MGTPNMHDARCAFICGFGLQHLQREVSPYIVFMLRLDVFRSFLYWNKVSEAMQAVSNANEWALMKKSTNGDLRLHENALSDIEKCQSSI